MQLQIQLTTYRNPHYSHSLADIRTGKGVSDQPSEYKTTCTYNRLANSCRKQVYGCNRRAQRNVIYGWYLRGWQSGTFLPVQIGHTLSEGKVEKNRDRQLRKCGGSGGTRRAQLHWVRWLHQAINWTCKAQPRLNRPSLLALLQRYAHAPKDTNLSFVNLV